MGGLPILTSLGMSALPIHLVIDHPGISLFIDGSHVLGVQTVLGQGFADVTLHGLGHGHVMTSLLGHQPAVGQHLMEELGPDR